MKLISKILVLLVLTVLARPSFSQVGIAEQSAYLDSVLVDLSKTTDPDLALSIINQQLDLKNSLIEKLKFQIVQVDKDCYNTDMYYKKLNSQLDYEKSIYSDLIVRAQRLHSLMHQNFDVFSFDNLYQSFRQFLYIKWLTDYRLKKIQRIKALKNEISNVLDDLEKLRNKKNKLAEKLGVEQSFITKYSKSRLALLKEAEQSQSNNFSQEILRNNLDSVQSKTINKEQADEATVLFQIQKSYLIWPVKKAVIIKFFGESQLKDQSKVTIKNDGLDFLVPSTSKVHCVYNGYVAKIVVLPKDKYAVIVRHGNYYTVYSGLDHILVSVNDEISKDDVIGDFETENKNSVFNFQIWLGSEVLNPYDWLIKYPK